MTTLAFAASNHSQSGHRALVGYAANRMDDPIPDAVIQFVEINAHERPIPSPDRARKGGLRPFAQNFFDKIGAAKARLVAIAKSSDHVTAPWDGATLSRGEDIAEIAIARAARTEGTHRGFKR